MYSKDVSPLYEATINVDEVMVEANMKVDLFGVICDAYGGFSGRFSLGKWSPGGAKEQRCIVKIITIKEFLKLR